MRRTIGWAFAALVLLAGHGWAQTTTTTEPPTTTTSTTETTTTSTSTTTTTSSSTSSTTSTSSSTTSSTSTSTSTTSSTSSTIGSSVYYGTFLGVVTADTTSDITACPYYDATSLTVDATITSGTATVALQRKINTGGGSGFYAAGTPTSLSASGLITDTNPSGCYRVVVDCTGACNVGPIKWQWR